MVNGLSKRLQEQRQLQKLSQKEVAQALGVSPSVVSNYESGERTPSVEVLMALAGLYRCSTDYLLGLGFGAAAGTAGRTAAAVLTSTAIRTSAAYAGIASVALSALDFMK